MGDVGFTIWIGGTLTVSKFLQMKSLAVNHCLSGDDDDAWDHELYPDTMAANKFSVYGNTSEFSTSNNFFSFLVSEKLTFQIFYDGDYESSPFGYNFDPKKHSKVNAFLLSDGHVAVRRDQATLIIESLLNIIQKKKDPTRCLRKNKESKNLSFITPKMLNNATFLVGELRRKMDVFFPDRIDVGYLRVTEDVEEGVEE